VNSMNPMSWRQRVLTALALLLLIALGARLAAALLEPFVPVLVILLLLGGVFWIIAGRRR
jgi:hypothetical protein